VVAVAAIATALGFVTVVVFLEPAALCITAADAPAMVVSSISTHLSATADSKYLENGTENAGGEEGISSFSRLLLGGARAGEELNNMTSL
jgi:hypothetical protein